MTETSSPSPFTIPNIRLFIAFRVFFNARFYYPVFTILFLDFGLTLSQFAILNAIWAATIVLGEVPSGALADTFGRRNLLVFAGVLMVLEIALWVFAPRENLSLLFTVFSANRILSGLAEASASGADEALAYDSLKQEGDVGDWGRVLERMIQLQSVGFVVALLIGGAVYDPALMQKTADFFGLGLTVTRDATLRIPIYLTQITAVLTLLTTLMMKEVATEDCPEKANCTRSIADAFHVTFRAGRWILRTPFVLCVILFGLLLDSVIRMILTMDSQYFRMIEIPEALFGVIGSGFALLGFVVPRYARRLSERRTPFFNLGLIITLVFCGLIGMVFFWPVWGLIPALVLFSNMYFVNFFLSHYLNRATRSEQRATVLSFKSLSINLGYGLIGILYSLLLAYLRWRTGRIQPGLGGEALKNSVFIDSMAWFPWYFGAVLLGLFVFSAWALRHSDEYRRIDGGD